VYKTIDSPNIPMMDKESRMRKGFLPPVVSTQAEKGILKREPDRAGVATRNPTMTGPRSMTSWMLFAVGANNETAAKPTKKPRVAPVNPILGLPIALYRSFPSFIK